MGLIDRVVDRVAMKLAAITATNKGLDLKSPGIRAVMGWNDDGATATKPYAQVAIVYACVRRIASTLSQIPWKVYKIGSETEIMSGPIIELFRRVNPLLSSFQLWEAQAINLCLRGEAFVALDPARVQGVPVALWPLPPEDVKPRLDSADNLIGWEYRTPKAMLMIPADQMAQPKFFNPHDAIRGLAPLSPLAMTLKGLWASTRVNADVFEKDVQPGTVFSTDQALTEIQYERMKHDLISTRAGIDNSGRAILLEGGVKVASTRLTNKDMQFIEQIGLSREDVMMVFGVPKVELSLDDEVNKASGGVTSLGFMKKTIMPMAALIEDKMNAVLLNPLGMEGAFDFSSVDVLNEELERKVTAAKGYHDMGVPFDVVNEKLELGFPEFEGSDLPFAGRSAAPAFGAPAAEGEDPDADPAADDDEDPKPPKKPEGDDEDEEDDDDAKARKGFSVSQAMARYRDELWRAAATPLHAAQGKFTGTLRTYFHKAQVRFASSAQIGVDGTVTADWDKVLPVKELMRFSRSYIGQAMELGQRRAMAAAKRFDDDSLLGEVLRRRTIEITSIAATVRTELQEKVRAMIAQAAEEGWTEEQRAEAVEEIVGTAFSGGSGRARTIARTEMFGAYNEAEHTTLQEMDDRPTHKQWINSRDDRVRDEHEMDGEIVEWDQPFSNGLQYPMDPSGRPEDTINCRCVMIPIWNRG